MAERRVRTEFDANTAQFDRGVQRMNRNVRRFQRGTESRLDRIDRRFKRSAQVVGQLRSALGALVAVAGARQLAGSFDRVLTRLDSIAKKADLLGLTTEELQELRFAAEQSGVAINAFDMGFQRFVRRAGQAAKGAGEAKDTFKALGITLEDLNQLGTAELFMRVAEELSKVERATERAAFAQKLFDSEGVAILNMIENVKQLRAEARELGIVMAEDMVRDGERMKTELGRQFAALDALWSKFVINFLRGADRIFSFVPSTIEEQLASRIEELRSVQSALAAGPGVMRGPLDTGGTAGLQERESELLGEIRTLEELRQAQQGVNDAIREAETAGGLAGLDSGGGGGAASAAAERTRETTEAIEEQERALDGKAAAERRAAEAARRHAEEQARIERAVQQVSDAILGAIESADSFAEALQNVAVALARVAQQELSQPGGGFFGDLFSSIFSSSAAPSSSPIPPPRPVAHAGGVIGRDSFPTRNVPDFVFAGAQRLHSGGVAGLRPNEVPAILEKGEVVVPKNIGLGHGGNNVTMGDMVVNITEPGATPEQINRIMAEHRKQWMQDLIELNEDDPNTLHT